MHRKFLTFLKNVAPLYFGPDYELVGVSLTIPWLVQGTLSIPNLSSCRGLRPRQKTHT